MMRTKVILVILVCTCHGSLPILAEVAEKGSQSNAVKAAPQRSPKTSSGGIQGLEDPKKRKMGRKLSSIKRSNLPKVWFLGPTFNFDGPLASVRSGSTLSRGVGFGAGLAVSYRMPLLRVEFQPAYRYLKLGRALDGSGALVDSTPTEFEQKVHYLGTGASVSWLIEEGSHREEGLEPFFWLDLGTEMLFPLSGKQTSSVFDEIKIKAPMLWWVLLGGTLDFQLSREQSLQARLHVFYNLPGNSEGRLFGVRAQIAFNFGLL